MTVYIDSFILINLMLNFLILLAVKKLLRFHTPKPRIFAGSLIGTAYALFMFMPKTAFIFCWLGKLAFSLIITVVTYRHTSFLQYIKTVTVFYIVSFAFGGCVYAITGHSELKIVVSAAVGAYFLIDMFSCFYKRLCTVKNSTVKVTISLGDTSAEFDAIIDTGSALTEPASGLPVVVAELDSLREILPYTVCCAYDSGLCVYDTVALSEGVIRLNLIPFKSLGKEHGFIAGFVPSKTEIDGKEVKCAIGIYDRRLSADGVYRGLVNPVLL